MILLDTSVWIDHLRSGDPELVAPLQDGRALAQPWVTGELALGHLSRRSEILGLLHPHVARTEETENDEPLLSRGFTPFPLDATSVRGTIPATSSG